MVKLFWASLLGFLTSIYGVAAAAEERVYGQPVDRGLNLQPGVTPVKMQMEWFHDMLLWVISGIVAFVFLLLLYVVIRFNRRANPVPSKTAHNVTIEIIWTIVPAFIVLAIAFPSLKMLYFMDKTHDADMTIKTIGRQWYWDYEYPDQGNFKFTSRMLRDKDGKTNGAPVDANGNPVDEPRLLAVDNRVVVPVGATVRLLVTGGDVIHSWAMPSFGVKKDAIPGRLNETWFRVDRPGIYYGQCSEICGADHAFMPIAVEAVEPAKFEEWVKLAHAKANERTDSFDWVDGPPPAAADADPAAAAPAEGAAPVAPDAAPAQGTTPAPAAAPAANP